jgi:hypothetical protein
MYFDKLIIVSHIIYKWIEYISLIFTTEVQRNGLILYHFFEEKLPEYTILFNENKETIYIGIFVASLIFMRYKCSETHRILTTKINLLENDLQSVKYEVKKLRKITKNMIKDIDYIQNPGDYVDEEEVKNETRKRNTITTDNIIGDLNTRTLRKRVAI